MNKKKCNIYVCMYERNNTGLVAHTLTQVLRATMASNGGGLRAHEGAEWAGLFLQNAGNLKMLKNLLTSIWQSSRLSCRGEDGNLNLNVYKASFFQAKGTRGRGKVRGIKGGARGRPGKKRVRYVKCQVKMRALNPSTKEKKRALNPSTKEKKRQTDRLKERKDRQRPD